MTFTAKSWPRFAEPGILTSRGWRRGISVVWQLELVKISRLMRVQAVVIACAVLPFLVAAAVKVQDTVPADTLFGQWLHESGFALPMVILGFAGQWALPLLTAIVSGDVFSAEDHLGTWKMVLTRSRSRGEVFAGKALAALTYAIAVLLLLAVASLLAGLVLGTDPVVGLSGQLVSGGHAATLVLLSWAAQLPPLLAYSALAMLLSVASRNSVVGMGSPVLIGLVFQLLSLVNLPPIARDALLSTPFAAWHGFWVEQPFYGPLWHGCITSGVWFIGCFTAAWIIFLRRSMRVS